MKLLFPGSFDPFTLGHKDIVDRAVAMGNEVVVGIGTNSEKQTMFSLDERMERIRRTYSGNTQVSVAAYEGLTTDFALRIGADAMLRGVRSLKDFEYEQGLADINRQLSGIDTLLLITEPRLAAISSSVVRELLSYGKDITNLIP